MAAKTKAKKTEETTAVVPASVDKITTYTPYMASEPIQLSQAIVLQLFAAKTKDGVAASRQDISKFIGLCVARKLNPYEGDAFLVGFDTRDGAKFNLITAFQALLKRAEGSKEYDGKESGVIVKTKAGDIIDRVGAFTLHDDTLLGAWAKAYRSDRRFCEESRVKLKAFKQGFGRWIDDPEGMIVKCGEASSLRALFPNTLGGLYTDEEMSKDGHLPEAKKVAKLFDDRVQGVVAAATAIEAEVLEKEPEPPPVYPHKEEPTKWGELLDLVEHRGHTQSQLLTYLYNNKTLLAGQPPATTLSDEVVDGLIESLDELCEQIEAANFGLE